MLSRIHQNKRSLHVATQSITIRGESRTSGWTRILPDTESVWGQVESRLHSHAIGPAWPRLSLGGMVV